MSSNNELVELDNVQKLSTLGLKSTLHAINFQDSNLKVSKLKDSNLTLLNKQLDIEKNISSSLDEFFEIDPTFSTVYNDNGNDADVDSIIEEINKLSRQSPISHYDCSISDKSVEEILQEAEKIYQESSKSFEQLSSKSVSSYYGTKSKKTVSKSNFSTAKIDSNHEQVINTNSQNKEQSWFKIKNLGNNDIVNGNEVKPNRNNNETEFNNNEILLTNNCEEIKINTNKFMKKINGDSDIISQITMEITNNDKISEEINNAILSVEKPNGLTRNVQIKQVSNPEESIEDLRGEIEALKKQLTETKEILKKKESLLTKQTCNLQQELDTAIETLKDTREQNTVLQLQLDNLTKTHKDLKNTYEDLVNVKHNLEVKLIEIDGNYSKCRSELSSIKESNDKLLESEANLKKILELERVQYKTARVQSEKDGKCIQDLNRQVKEMERIIQRKYPDSVSKLIVPANKIDVETNSASKTLLENRIKQLEHEANVREAQSSNVFTEIQGKFNHMKQKYERHIQDLEDHVKNLKEQLQLKMNTFDVYTQTYADEQIKINLFTIGTQTDFKPEPSKPTQEPVPAITHLPKKLEKVFDIKEDAHLIATIRGLQTELAAKDKLYAKLQKELEDLRKTNRKLLKDREMNLRLASERKDKFYDKTTLNKSTEATTDYSTESDIRILQEEKEKLKIQLCRLEEEFQSLKTKRLQDLNILQEAHEKEITTYMTNIGPMREQLDIQQISIGNLQAQLANAKEELAILSVERDHLNSRVKQLTMLEMNPEDATSKLALQKKIASLEHKYEEREHRLRAIVHSLAQKQVTSKDCSYCTARQQQLMKYKAELDQLLITLRFLQ